MPVVDNCFGQTYLHILIASEDQVTLICNVSYQFKLSKKVKIYRILEIDLQLMGLEPRKLKFPQQFNHSYMTVTFTNLALMFQMIFKKFCLPLEKSKRLVET